jgi:hypothetical protein
VNIKASLWLCQDQNAVFSKTASLLSLRALPVSDPRCEPFVGFGNPVFNAAQMLEAPIADSTLSQRGFSPDSIALRGIRISDNGERLDSDKLQPVHLGQFCRLPDTADEIRQIAMNFNQT